MEDNADRAGGGNDTGHAGMRRGLANALAHRDLPGGEQRTEQALHFL